MATDYPVGGKKPFDPADIVPNPDLPTLPWMVCYQERVEGDTRGFCHLQTLVAHPRMRFIGRYNFKFPEKFRRSCDYFHAVSHRNPLNGHQMPLASDEKDRRKQSMLEKIFVRWAKWEFGARSFEEMTR